MHAIVETAGARTVGDATAASLRRIAIATVSCGIAGILVGGMGSRLVMRISALAAPAARGLLTENGNVVGEITLAGTIGLLVFAGIGSAVLGAGALVVFDPWLPRRTAPRGLVFGAFLLAFAGTFVLDPTNVDFLVLGNRALNVAMFSSLFLAFGLVASAAMSLLDRRVPPADAVSLRQWAAMMILALPVVPGLVGVALSVGPEFGLPLIAARSAVGAARALDRRRLDGAARTIRVVATITVAAVLAVTGREVLRSIGAIL